MLYNFYFDIAAVILVMGVVFIYLVRRNYPTAENRLYLSMALANGIACTADIISAFTISYPQDYPLWFNYLVNIVYMAGNVCTAALFLLYVLRVTESDERVPALKNVTIFVFFVLAAGTLSTPVTHLVFYFDDAGTYLHGKGYLLLYIATFAILGASVGFLFTQRKRLNAYQVFPPIVSTSIVIVAIITQALVPGLLLEGFAVSVMLVVVYAGTEANSKYMHSGSYCYNFRAFRDQVDRRIKRKEPFGVVAFGFDDMPYLRNIFDLTATQEMALSVCGALQERFGQARVFYLRDCNFAVIGDMDHEDQVIESIVEIFREMDAIPGFNIKLEPCFCTLHHPGLIRSGREADDVIVFALAEREEKGGEKVTRVEGGSLAKKRREGAVVRAMRRAIVHDGFEVYFQPVYHVETGDFRSAEVLVRLNAPELGSVSPDEFIPLAESNGMIIDIGDQVLRKLCEFWRDENPSELGVSCLHYNLSAVQCAQSGMATRFLTILEECGVPAHCVNVEVTETALIVDRFTALENLRVLHEAGVKFSLDDYGTGYSSVENVFRLPFDLIKVDKSLVWGAMEDDQALAVLKSTVGMCHALGKMIVAEGVETEEMESLLKVLGVEHLQGYKYSKPVPRQDYLEFLRENAYGGLAWCQPRFMKLSAQLAIEDIRRDSVL